MKRTLTTSLALIAVPLAVAACGGPSGAATGGSGAAGDVALIAYSTPQTVYEEELIPGFQGTREGRGVAFSTSFGSSGDQSRAVEAGQPADLVHLPLEPDIERLVEAGLVAAGYAEEEPNGGIVQTSAVAFGVRPGNPEGIEDWDDLVREDVEVLTPNPFTSCGARWNILAAYGQALARGADEQEALDFVRRMLDNTVVQDASARDSLNSFIGGLADVVVSYESEIIGAQLAGAELELVVPQDTIRIDTIAVRPIGADPAAESFVRYMHSPDGQRIFARNGYRPVDERVAREFEAELPQLPGLFGIEDLGGWHRIEPKLFDPDTGAVAEIQRDLGVVTE